MSRMNNTSRSLRIISIQNGWDPYQIQGGGSIEPLYHCRENPFESDTWPIPGEATSPQSSRPATTAATTPSFNTPILRENEDHRGGGSDPFPGMPGAQ